MISIKNKISGEEDTNFSAESREIINSGTNFDGSLAEEEVTETRVTKYEPDYQSNTSDHGPSATMHDKTTNKSVIVEEKESNNLRRRHGENPTVATEVQDTSNEKNSVPKITSKDKDLKLNSGFLCFNSTFFIMSLIVSFVAVFLSGFYIQKYNYIYGETKVNLKPMTEIQHGIMNTFEDLIALHGLVHKYEKLILKEEVKRFDELFSSFRLAGNILVGRLIFIMDSILNGHENKIKINDLAEIFNKSDYEPFIFEQRLRTEFHDAFELIHVFEILFEVSKDQNGNLDIVETKEMGVLKKYGDLSKKNNALITTYLKKSSPDKFDEEERHDSTWTELRKLASSFKDSGTYVIGNKLEKYAKEMEGMHKESTNGVSRRIYFQEKFDNDSWSERWITSKHGGKTFGKFKLTAGNFYGNEKDKGIKTSDDAHFYATGAKFSKFSIEKKTLVLQFSVKHEQNIDCGGGYLKLYDCNFNPEEMHGQTPFLIMFGPDICGPGTSKVHVMVNYKGKGHMINKNILCKTDVYTHVYTLIVEPDDTYQILIDGEDVQSGSVQGDWSFLPPKKIKNPKIKKPEDWDDRVTLDDPEDTKPEDWDQTEYIPDPDFKKPDDWDDEMDGEWEPPHIENPAFKGKWKPKQIENPAYKGPWFHPEIENPEYKVDSEIYRYSSYCGIGFDIWQVKSGTIFDNIIITNSVLEAKEDRDRVLAYSEAEKKMKEAQDDK